MHPKYFSVTKVKVINETVSIASLYTRYLRYKVYLFYYTPVWITIFQRHIHS